MKLVDTVTHLGLDSIDQELRQIHTYLRTTPMTSEDRRAMIKRMDILLERRLRLTNRAATMIEK